MSVYKPNDPLSVILALWMFLPAREGATNRILGSLILQHLTLKPVLILAVVIGGLVGWTWKNQISGMWILLSGQPVLIHGASVGIPLLISGLIVDLVPRFAEDPAYGSRLAGFLPTLVLAPALLKAAVASGSLVTLRRLNLASAAVLLRFMSVWFLVTVGAGFFSAGYCHTTWYRRATSHSVSSCICRLRRYYWHQ